MSKWAKKWTKLVSSKKEEVAADSGSELSILDGALERYRESLATVNDEIFALIENTGLTISDIRSIKQESDIAGVLVKDEELSQQKIDNLTGALKEKLSIEEDIRNAREFPEKSFAQKFEQDNPSFVQFVRQSHYGDEILRRRSTTSNLRMHADVHKALAGLLEVDTGQVNALGSGKFGVPSGCDLEELTSLGIIKYIEPNATGVTIEVTKPKQLIETHKLVQKQNTNDLGMTI